MLIVGRVNHRFQPMVKAQLQLSNGEFDAFELKFDTGFNGELGLSSDTLQRLRKEKEDLYVVRLADGRLRRRQGYLVEMRVNGERLTRIALDMGDGGDLIGMTACPGWEANIQIRINGDVKVTSDQHQ